MSDRQYSKPVRLAHAALLAAIDENWQKAERALARLSAECDSDGLAWAMTAWCDALITHMMGDAPEPDRVRLVGWDTDTGSLGDPPRESVRWGMELIEARAHRDIDAFQSCLGRLNAIEDGWERGRWAVDLVQSVALTIRSLPHGFAVMGRGAVE